MTHPIKSITNPRLKLDVLSPEDVDKIFMPFRRAGKTDVPGEGMGLAYTQALVNRHGGHIQCHSEAGEGSVFSFTIPITIPASFNEVT